jgi:hypothetical protein
MDAMGGETPGDRELAACYRRLAALQDQLEHEEFRRNARVDWMRVNELVESQRKLDDVRDRRDEAVRDARKLGMPWATIADALQISEEEAGERFAGVDRLSDPDPPRAPVHYEW